MGLVKVISKNLKMFIYSLLVILVVGGAYANTVSATTIPQADLDAINYNWVNWDPGSSSSSCSSISLSGSDAIQQAFNFFISQGLTAVQSAGIVGNLLLESAGTMNPEIVEGGSTQSDPTNLTGQGQGYGIAQWTPGNKLITLAQQYNITTPVNELVTQLQVLWDEINSGGANSIVAGLKALSNTGDTTTYFQDNFERPASDTASIQERINYANSVIQLYGGSAGGAGTISSNGGCHASVSCTANTGGAISGNAAIACDVLQYDPLSYCEASSCPGLQAGHLPGAEWHSECPAISTTCSTDCSGLVSLAIYDVFGNDGVWSTYTMVSDKSNFEIIPFGNLQPGDFVEPNPGHVVVVESISGNTITGFAAMDNFPIQANDVGTEIVPAGPGNVYLRYIGAGSTYSH
jgi:hypothetical protein